jgi:hypothetical protein
VLLSLYILVAVRPAVLVLEEYLDPHPNSLANSLVHHYRLSAPTSEFIHNVFGGPLARARVGGLPHDPTAGSRPGAVDGGGGSAGRLT